MSASGAGPKFHERTVVSPRVKSELDRIFDLLLWLVSRKTARPASRRAPRVSGGRGDQAHLAARRRRG